MLKNEPAALPIAIIPPSQEHTLYSQDNALPVVIKPREKSATPLELLIVCKGDEFFGEKKSEDQILWRRRNEEKAFVNYLCVNGRKEWAEITFSTLPKGWHGTVYLSLTSNITANMLNSEENFIAKREESFKKLPEEFIKSARNLILGINCLIQSLQDFEEKRFLKQIPEICTLLASRSKVSRFLQGTEQEAFNLWLQKYSLLAVSITDWQSNAGKADWLSSRQIESERLKEASNELVSIAFSLESVVIRHGRGAICSSFEGEWASVIIRGQMPGGSPLLEDNLKTQWNDQSNWKPSTKSDKKRPFSFESYVNVIYNSIFLDKSKVSTGLIVIMAETSAGKSQIAYGLMHRYLADHLEEGKFVHALSLEDPIEKKAFKVENYPEDATGKTNAVVHYTARHKTLDTTLHEGLHDALRQKPAIVCVGEIREKEDWNAVMDFAATGHLVVATAHADKLSTSMGKILNARGANTAARRGDEARRILAMIHLQKEEVEMPQAIPEDERKREIILMTLWRRINGGANALVSAGRDSIAPHWGKDRGVIGAQTLCKNLLDNVTGEKAEAPKKEEFKKAVTDENLFKKAVMNAALRHDCRGI